VAQLSGVVCNAVGATVTLCANPAQEDRDNDAEIDSGNPSLDWQSQRMTRYDLTRLDELAGAW
jgi:hypothetical protein